MFTRTHPDATVPSQPSIQWSQHEHALVMPAKSWCRSRAKWFGQARPPARRHRAENPGRAGGRYSRLHGGGARCARLATRAAVIELEYEDAAAAEVRPDLSRTKVLLIRDFAVA